MSNLLSRSNQQQDVPTRDQIARRAYQIYEERGREPGRDVDDWLAAERELRNQNLSPARGFADGTEKPAGPAGSRSRQPKLRVASAFEGSRSADVHTPAKEN